jgi:type IV pilus biogenesis protein PilP
MTADKVQLSSLTARQKVVAGVVVLLTIFLIWQIKGMFSGGSSTPAVQPKLASSQSSSAMHGSPAPGGNSAPMSTNANLQQSKPQPVTQVVGQQPLSPREMELIRLQQETEAKYIAALNELQLLKINQSIAETNKAIAAAKLDTVTAQKGVVDLLTTPAPTSASYAQNLGGRPTVASTQGPARPAAMQPQVSYTVISVSRLQYKWNAVLGSQGNLYSVTIGDRLPPDNSKVIAIDKSGVTLEKDGVTTKHSLVPII